MQLRALREHRSSELLPWDATTMAQTLEHVFSRQHRLAVGYREASHVADQTEDQKQEES